jgi:hypothetical protein
LRWVDAAESGGVSCQAGTEGERKTVDLEAPCEVLRVDPRRGSEALRALAASNAVEALWVVGHAENAVRYEVGRLLILVGD